jgi:hypothetical protein
MDKAVADGVRVRNQGGHMLILTREVGQSIVIGEDIKLTILRVDGAKFA